MRSNRSRIICFEETLEKHGVKLLDGGLDEAPQAYKDIEAVMRSQKQLVDIVGKFIPRIVKMDGAAPKKWKNKKARNQWKREWLESEKSEFKQN